MSTKAANSDNRQPTASGASTMRERPLKRRRDGWALNLRLLIGTAAILAVSVPAGYQWHDYQVSRNASVFLARAAEHEKDGKWWEAGVELHRYLRLMPKDLA